jgi:Arc/MetJ-type ribon-helix-helix transcriptional regulator
MNVALPADLEKRVNETVERGEFANRDEFFKQAAELLLDLRHDFGAPIPMDQRWESRVRAFIDEAQSSGEATEMTDEDWHEVERRGLALIQAEKITPAS